MDSNIYGIALVTADGKVYTVGDVKSEVSIQSISKVFTLAKVLEEQGPEAIANTIGVDATGMRFNSIVSIELSQKVLGGPEMNSLVNPGAIATTSMVKGSSRDQIWNSILGFYSEFAGRNLSVNQEVFKSEADTNQRNQAIGYLMYAYGYIKDNPMQATDIYTEQCSVSVNAQDLATMAATLANGGKNPVTGKQVMKAENVPEVLAVMATAGLYDDSGKWLYNTGLPGKSGVGGGIIAVSPGKFGIAVISPPWMTQATASRLRRQSRTSRTRSAETRTRRRRDRRDDMMKTTGIVLLFLALPFTAFSQKAVSESEVVELTAEITAIDHDARILTLEDDEGDVESLYAGPEIKRFSELKVGDKVTFRYYESLVSQIRKAGDAAPARGTGAPTLVRGTGAKPSATLSQQLTATVTVKAIDPAVPSVTVTLEDGRTMSFKVEDKKNLEGVKVGDKVDVTYTAAVMITVK